MSFAQQQHLERIQWASENQRAVEEIVRTDSMRRHRTELSHVERLRRAFQIAFAAGCAGWLLFFIAFGYCMTEHFQVRHSIPPVGAGSQLASPVFSGGAR